jgi:hypothetical protein
MFWVKNCFQMVSKTTSSVASASETNKVTVQNHSNVFQNHGDHDTSDTITARPFQRIQKYVYAKAFLVYDVQLFGNSLLM